MRAAVMRNQQIVVDEIADPVPGPGEVLAETIACGICGSDLHALVHSAELIKVAIDTGLSAMAWDQTRDVVMGHEFSARILELGPGVDSVEIGAEVAAMPGHRSGGRMVGVGYSNDYPGGYGERMVLGERSLRVIPNGLDPKLAALTEPTAVGLHAVNRSSVGELGQGALVIGTGPVGLSIIASLAARGVAPIVAADFSPTRRRLAEVMGAHVVVDPREQPAIEALAAETGSRRDPVVAFEAVGVPGTIDEQMRSLPRNSELVIAGVCMQSDTIWPTYGINKELTLRFVLGWTPDEFTESLHNIAEGRIDVAPLVTGEVGIDGVADAFTALADPETHAKILVRPSRS